MVDATTYTVKVQGTELYMTRPLGSPVLVGNIRDFGGLGGAVNEIDIGSFADTEEMTRPGRTSTVDTTFNIHLNPDAAIQEAMKEVEGTDEILTWTLVYPTGTLNSRSFTGYLSLFGDSAGDNNIYMGSVTIAVLTNEVMS